MAAKVTGVQDSGNNGFIVAVIDGYIMKWRLPDQAVNGMFLRSRIIAAPVGGQRDRLPGDGRDNGLAVGGKLAANAIGVRQQNRPADLEDFVA